MLDDDGAGVAATNDILLTSATGQNDDVVNGWLLPLPFPLTLSLSVSSPFVANIAAPKVKSGQEQMLTENRTLVTVTDPPGEICKSSGNLNNVSLTGHNKDLPVGSIKLDDLKTSERNVISKTVPSSSTADPFLPFPVVPVRSNGPSVAVFVML